MPIDPLAIMENHQFVRLLLYVQLSFPGLSENSGFPKFFSE
jgi:hypothetical protein